MECLKRLAAVLGVDTSRWNDVTDVEDSKDPKDSPDTVSPDSRTTMVRTLDMPEGWLVTAPRGGHHYVGPASLIYFARCTRELVGVSKTIRQPTFDEAGLRRYLQAAEFTAYKTSHAIEAGLPDHPATFAAGTTQSPSSVQARSPSLLSGNGRERLNTSTHRGLADDLIEAYFDRVHPNLPILHRGTVQLLYENSLNVALEPATEPGKVCTLYMVYTMGAQALEPRLETARAIQQQYLSVVIREGLGRLVLTSALINVQALLLLALYQHNAGERNTAYLLVGQAIRSAVACGLHKDGENGDDKNSPFDPFERNLRRTVWWWLHILEQTVSLALGRPSFTDVIHVYTSLPDETFDIGMGLPARYLGSYVALSDFMVKIKQAVGTVSVHYQDANRLVEGLATVTGIHSDLIAWKKSIPPTLSPGQTFTSPAYRRSILLLHIWADYLESVLCRPYLLGRVYRDLEQLDIPSEIEEIADLSVAAAHASVTKLLILANHDLLEPTVWLDYYTAQHAIMIVSLHFLGRPAGGDGNGQWTAAKDSIADLIRVAQAMLPLLAPTFRITMNVAFQLSWVAGVHIDVPPLPPLSASPNQAVSHTPFDLGAEYTFGMSDPLPAPGQTTLAQPMMYSDLYNLGFDASSGNLFDFFDIGNIASDYAIYNDPVPSGEGNASGGHTDGAKS